MLLWLVHFFSATEYFVRWDGDNKSICHPMLPCSWQTAVDNFEREDIIQIMDSELDTPEKLKLFQNMTEYALEIGGGISSANTTLIYGSNYIPEERDFFLEVSPFNESIIFGFSFINFQHPVISVRGKEIFMIINCSFTNCEISFDFPLISFCNVTVIIENVSIEMNQVEGTSILGLNTAIMGFFNSVFQNNIQLSRGPIPLIEFTNGAAEITNSSFTRNVTPNSPLLGSWFYIIVLLTNSTFSNNVCGSSSLIVGDSLANVTLSMSQIIDNQAAILHSMTMSSLNLSNSILARNNAAGQALVFAPRSTIHFINNTLVANNTADSIISSQLSNETSLNLISTKLVNNICADTAFAFYNSKSTIENATLKSNLIVGHTLLSLKISNFTINSTKFENNVITSEGEIVEIEDSSVEVNDTHFRNNKGSNSGAFQIGIKNNNKSLSFVFSKSSFSNNTGKVVDSVFFSEELTKARFEYCSFAKMRFEEVNGDLNSEQLFHRCRFEGNADKETNVIQLPDIKVIPSVSKYYWVVFLIYLISTTMLGIAYFKSQDSSHKQNLEDNNLDYSESRAYL